MKNYIAWLNGHSVARGTLADVRAKAADVLKSPAFQDWGNWPCTVKITHGARQSFVESRIVRKGDTY